MGKTTIGIAEDQMIYRNGLINLLHSTDKYKVTIEAEDGKELLGKMRGNEPQVVILDYLMPNMTGIEATKQIKKKYPEVKVLILSMYDSNEFVVKAIENGANGYLTKDDDPKEIMNAIDSVLSTGYYLNDRTSKVLINQMMSKGVVKPQFHDETITFTELELNIIKLICQERSTGEIAEELCKSSRTIDGHRSVIMKKIDARNLIGIVMYAFKNNLVN